MSRSEAAGFMILCGSSISHQTEAALAREAGLHFAGVAFSINYAAGGLILKKMDELGVAENTIVIWTAAVGSPSPLTRMHHDVRI